MEKLIALLLILVLQSQFLFAQITTYKRLEIPIENRKGKDFQTFLLKEDGLLVMLESGEYQKGGNKELIFWRLDSAFNNLWSVSVKIDYETEIVSSIYQPPYKYFLLKENQHHSILKLNVFDKLFEIIDYKDIFEAEIKSFEAIDGKILLAGTVDSRPFIIHYDPISGLQKPLQSLPQEKVGLSSMQVDIKTKQIFAALSGKQTQLKNVFFLKYDSIGNLLNNISFPNNIDYEMQTYRFYAISNNEFLVLGTYSEKNSTKPQGIYSIHFQGNELKNERFYDFGYLKNYYSYQTPKQRKKTELSVEKAALNDDFIKHSLDFSIGELQIFQDEILLCLEGFVPMFSNSMPFDNNFSTFNTLRYNNLGRFYTRPNRFTEMGNRNATSFRYKNAIILAFDKKGKLLWDNSFEYDDHETIVPLAPLAISVRQDSLFAMDYRENSFFIKKSLKTQNNEPPQKIELPKTFENVAILNQESGKVYHWFAKYFIFESYQQVRTNPNDKRKKVFVLSQIGINGYEDKNTNEKK